MKTITIRFDDYVAAWINNSCQRNRVTISEFIRNALYEKMHQGYIVINYIKNKQFILSPHYRTEIGYNIFTAKLLEGFIVATLETGLELRNKAFTATEELLAALKLNISKVKGHQICVNLEQELYLWLQQEANRLQLKLAKLIRKLIEEVAIVEISVSNRQLSPAEKIGIKHQVICCKLLEGLIKNTVNNAEHIINEARTKAEGIVLNLFPENDSNQIEAVKNRG